MQVMGDWVKGELSAGSYRPGEGYRVPAEPGSARAVQLQPRLHRHVQAA